VGRGYAFREVRRMTPRQIDAALGIASRRHFRELAYQMGTVRTAYWAKDEDFRQAHAELAGTAGPKGMEAVDEVLGELDGLRELMNGGQG